MNLSIVIPLLNEEESLIELHDWIVAVMQSNRFSYEILFIDDGSTDASWDIITQLSDKNPNVKNSSASHKPYMQGLRPRMVMLLSLWMLTFKIIRKRSQNYML